MVARKEKLEELVGARGASRGVVLLLVVVTLVAMGRLVGGEFTFWDDNETIHQNPWMNPASWGTVGHYWTTAYMGLYVPVTYTVWAGLAGVARLGSPDERGIWLNPAVFHGANVIVHVVNTLIVFAILRRVVNKEWAAAVGAMVFGVHPVQVEAVGWVSGMKDLLCGLFVLGGVWNYLVYAEGRKSMGGSPTPRGGRGHYWLAAGLVVLGTLSKPTAVVAPVVMAVLDRWVVGRSWREVGRSVWPVAVAVVPCVVWAKVVQDVPAKAPVWVRPLVALDALAFYVGKVVWPARLAVDYGRNPKWAVGSGVIWWTWLVPVLIGLALWVGRKRAGVLVAGGGVFVGGVLPVLGLVAFMFQGISTVADHYLYVPMLGVGMAVAWGVERASRSDAAQRVVGVVAGIGVGVLVVRSVVQCGVWRDDFALNANTLAVNPQSNTAHVNQASALEYKYRTQGDAAARELAVRHLREAIRVKPESIVARQNLAIIVLDQGNVEEGLRLLTEGIEIAERLPGQSRQDLGPSYRVLGAVLERRGRLAEAAGMYRKALEYDPGDERVRASLAGVERAIREGSAPGGTTGTP